MAVRRADDPAREAAEGGVFAALFPPCFPDLGAHVDGGGGHTVLKYGTLAERDSLAYKLVSAVQRDVNALGSAARGGAPKLTLEAAAAKLAAIATLEPETLRLEEPKCFRDFDANAFAGAREASATRSLATHTAAAAALLEMARAVGRLRPARRVLAAQLSNARDVCDAARLAPPAELIDAEGRAGRTDVVHLQALIDAYRQWLLGRSYVVKHVGGGYELTQWDHSSGLVKEAPVDYWRCLVRARAVHTSTVPADDAPPATAPSRVHAMLASSKPLADEYRPGARPASAGARGARSTPASPAVGGSFAGGAPLAGSLSRLRATPAFPGDPRALSSTAPPARAARPASAGPPRRRVGAALHERYTPPPRASAVHNQMLREYERAYGVAPLSAEALRAARGRR